MEINGDATRMKQIMVIGAGSVGGYFGAHLLRKYPGVSFLLRPKTQVAVATNGLTIRSAIGESFTVHPQSSSIPQNPWAVSGLRKKGNLES